MIDYHDAETLLVEYIGDDSRLLAHSRAVANLLYDVCLRLNRIHPELGIDPSSMKVVGLLHDLAKPIILYCILFLEENFWIKKGFRKWLGL